MHTQVYGGEAAQFGDAGFGGGDFNVAGSKAAFASEWGQQDMGFGQGQEQYQAEWATEQQYHGQEYATSPVAANPPTSGV